MANDQDLRHDPVPEGLVEALSGVKTDADSERLTTARRHAQSRRFDEPTVLHAIASELLAMSLPESAAAAS